MKKFIFLTFLSVIQIAFASTFDIRNAKIGSTILKDWCKQKGIDSSISYAIAYKIAREGTKVPNKFNSGKLVSDVITKERTDKLMDALKEEFKSDIKSKMIEQLKK